jgi:hypothetical protein
VNKVVVSQPGGAQATVTLTLPAAVGSNPAAPPMLACYTQNPTTQSWWTVTDGFSATSIWCLAAISGGTWTVTFFNVSTGWAVAAVVVF